MHFTDLPKIKASPRAVAVSEAIFPRRHGASGSIDRFQAEFLLSAMELCDARTVVELGVASGGSTLYMLAMLHEMAGPRKLWAFDLNATYFADESRPVGYLASESEFNLPERFVLASDICSADVRGAMAKASTGEAPLVDLAFIDAHHGHPWPTFDFIMLLPLMREGGFIVLHDINLPLVMNRARGYGPMRLFAKAFAERFVLPGDAPNIGAVRVRDKAAMLDLAIEALSEPWEVEKLHLPLVKRMVAEIRTGPLAGYAGALAPFLPGLRA